MRRYAQQTCSSLVEEYLRKLDDFATAKMIREATRLNSNQVSASLYELRGYRVVECEAVKGQLWWFALPPESDARAVKREFRRPEVKPRKPRGKRHNRLARVG